MGTRRGVAGTSVSFRANFLPTVCRVPSLFVVVSFSEGDGPRVSEAKTERDPFALSFGHPV